MNPKHFVVTEEEWKRYYESLSHGYQAVNFSYDAFGQPQYSDQGERCFIFLFFSTVCVFHYQFKLNAI